MNFPIVKTSKSRAFTLVELLVVIGIIALLISILLPTLSSARQRAAVVACLSNVRQLSVATAGYVSENRNTLPEAVYNNKTGLLSPSGTGLEAWTPTMFNGVPAYVLPSSGDALRGYTGDDGTGIWECPNGGPEYNAKDPFQVGGDNPLDGIEEDDVWLPNYYYHANKLYVPFSNPSVEATRVFPDGSGAAPFNAADWTVRNIAGLRTSQANPVGGGGSSDVVVFSEYKSTFHTQSDKDVYQLAEDEKTEFLGNYAYLDGHGETQKYTDRDGYMAQLHNPIRQRWYGVEFDQQFPEQYEAENFYEE